MAMQNRQRYGLGLGPGRGLQQSGYTGLPSSLLQAAQQMGDLPTFMGKEGMELPIKKLGSIPSGVKGLGGLSPEDAVAKWEEMSKGMSAEEIKALGDPIDVQVYDTDLIGKRFGLSEDEISAALDPQYATSDKYKNEKGKVPVLSEEQKILRGLGTMLADERNLIDFEGNWDMYNLANKMGIPSRLGGISEYQSGLLKKFGGNRYTMDRHGMGVTEEQQAQADQLGNINQQNFLEKQTFGEAYNSRVKLDKEFLKKSGKDDDIADYIGQGMGIIMPAFATGALAFAAPHMLAANFPGLAAGLGSALGIGSDTTALSYIAGGAASKLAKGVAPMLANRVLAGAPMKPGQVIKAQGGAPQLFDPALAQSNYEYNMNMLQQQMMMNQLQRSNSPLTSSRQLGGF